MAMVISHSGRGPSMGLQRFGALGVPAAVISLVLLASISVAGQTARSAASSAVAPDKWTAPRTLDGQPDLQGVWSFANLTPLERPRRLAGKEFFTPEEAVAFERQTIERNNKDRRDQQPGTTTDVGRAYNDFWWDRGTKVAGTRRTSLIIAPPDGRIPPLTPEARKRAAARAEFQGRVPGSGPGEEVEDGTQGGVDGRGGRADWTTDRSLSERCILGFNSGPPMLPSAYNNNVQLFQTRDHLVILNEMVHNARIVPLDGRPHLPRDLRQWVGDSRCRWEDQTLVVETTNFTDQTAFRGSGKNLRLIERFTRTAPDTLVYEFTIDDPASFPQPWTAQVPMIKSDEKMYEYACHEGNYGLHGILAGARAKEAEEPKQTKTK